MAVAGHAGGTRVRRTRRQGHRRELPDHGHVLHEGGVVCQGVVELPVHHVHETLPVHHHRTPGRSLTAATPTRRLDGTDAPWNGGKRRRALPLVVLPRDRRCPLGDNSPAASTFEEAEAEAWTASAVSVAAAAAGSGCMQSWRGTKR